MTNQEYDKTEFFVGIKAKVEGKWYPVSTADFETRSITCFIGITEKVFSVNEVQEFTTLKRIS